jgi:hypothetical protein
MNSPQLKLEAKFFQLSVKLYKDKEIDLTVDEAALIKERVRVTYGPLVYGRVCELLDK